MEQEPSRLRGQKGGSFANLPSDLQGFARSGGDPRRSGLASGFRCARDPLVPGKGANVALVTPQNQCDPTECKNKAAACGGTGECIEDRCQTSCP